MVLIRGSGDHRLSQDSLSSRSLRSLRPRIRGLIYDRLWLSLPHLGRRCETPTLSEDDGPIFPVGRNVLNVVGATVPN
jgi:hypothetical protein